MINNPIIVALDNPTTCYDVAINLKDEVEWFKVGAIPYLKHGNNLIKRLKEELKAKVMLDLKFYDIPNTVTNACKVAGEMGVDMLTIHLSGGAKMIHDACEVAKDFDMVVLGVSVLTSFDAKSFNDMFPYGRDEIGRDVAIEDIVDHLVCFGRSCGCKGIVCSPQETKRLREKFKDLIIVNPGIRPADEKDNDQKRVATPGQAVENGASYLVIGRPIVEAPDPVEAVRAIKKSLGTGK